MSKHQTPPILPPGSSIAGTPSRDLAERVRQAQHAPPTHDDTSVLVGAHGRRATPDELRRFVASEQRRITRDRGR